jgi:alpha-ketoglutarate-dependent sulfate ester dioxygenase
MSITQTELHIRPLTVNIGAEISGVRLSADLPEETIAQIRAAALANKVVFFRGQHHLDDEEQVAFASRFGTVTRSHPTITGAQEPNVLEPTSSNDVTTTWHTDITFVIQPPSFSMLRSLVIPPVGGDTMWANTATAYAALPDELRELASKLWALHTNMGTGPRGGVTDRNSLNSMVFRTIHPVVRVHPETGERCLLLGAYARRFVGYDPPIFETIFKIYQDVISRPEHTVRWNWQVGDLVIWDNRATQHYAINDYGSAERRVRRVTVVGEIPVSIDGETGRAVQGDCSAYNRQTPGSASTVDAVA